MTCPICHHGDANTPCPACIDRVNTQLAHLDDLHQLAHHALVPTGTGDVVGTIGRPSSEPPAPCDLAALDLADGSGLLNALGGWELHWRTALGLTRYGVVTEYRLTQGHGRAVTTSLLGTTAFLRTWGTRAAEALVDWPVYAHHVRRLHIGARAALRLDQPSGRVTCPCGASITIDADGRTCPRCGTEWNLARLIAVASGPVWVDSATAQLILGTRFGVLVREGLVPRRGRGPMAVYDVAGARR